VPTLLNVPGWGCSVLGSITCPSISLPSKKTLLGPEKHPLRLLGAAFLRNNQDIIFLKPGAVPVSSHTDGQKTLWLRMVVQAKPFPHRLFLLWVPAVQRY